MFTNDYLIWEVNEKKIKSKFCQYITELILILFYSSFMKFETNWNMLVFFCLSCYCLPTLSPIYKCFIVYYYYMWLQIKNWNTTLKNRCWMEVWNTLPKPTARTKRTWFSITQLATLVVVKLPNHILTNVFAFDQNYILTSLHVGLSAINAPTSALSLWRRHLIIKSYTIIGFSFFSRK